MSKSYEIECMHGNTVVSRVRTPVRVQAAAGLQ